MEQLDRERFITADRQANPALFSSVIALCSRAGFSPNLVNSSATWSGVLTLVESGEGIALVPSGVRYLATKALHFAEIVPQTTHVGLALAWDPHNEGPVVKNFLRLVRANKDRIRKNV
jgi:DNA-binding transcriptional LysR family regulator